MVIDHSCTQWRVEDFEKIGPRRRPINLPLKKSGRPWHGVFLPRIYENSRGMGWRGGDEHISSQ